MKKHGASHGAAVLVCTITSALMIDFLKNHVPAVYYAINILSQFLLDLLGLLFPPVYLTILIYAAMLAVIWGVAFSFMHKDKSNKIRK